MKPLITEEQARERFEEAANLLQENYHTLTPRTDHLVQALAFQSDVILYLMQQVEQLKAVVKTECVTAQYGAACFDVLQDAQNDIADPNGVRYDPEFREAVLRGEKMCDFCRRQKDEKETA